MVQIRARVGGNLGTSTVYGRSVGGPLRYDDTAGIIARLRTFIAKVNATAPEATRIALIPTFELSQIYCPKDTGALVGSGYLEVTDRAITSSRDTVVEIGYGRNGNPPYALIVHEMVERHHSRPTRAKFLESAMKETQGKLLARIASLLRIR